jgi:hypothetical protein
MGVEGVLTGAALGLVLLVLVQERASAQEGTGPGLPGAVFEPEPGSGGRPAAPGHWQPRRPLQHPQPQARVPQVPWAEPQGLAAALPARSGVDRPATVARPTWDEAGSQRLVGQQSGLQGRGPGSPSLELVPQTAAWLADPLPPALLVQLRSHDIVVASTVDGLASALVRGRQAGIEMARIDLGGSALPLVVISSEHGLSARARSTTALAVLDLDLVHHGLRASQLRLAGIDGDTTLLTAEVINLAQLQPAVLGLRLDLVGLLNSQIHDSGGDDRLALTARSALILPPSALPEDAAIDLRNRALVDSSLVLAGGHNSLQVRSELTLPGPWQPRWELQAVALDNSQLQLGNGNDAVELLALAPRGDGVALRDSRLDLGGGDDQLLVQGQVLRSTIALGPGHNRATLRDPLHEATLVLSPGSSNRVELGDQADALQLIVDGDPTSTAPEPPPLVLELRAGGGDDRLWLPQLPATGSLTLWGGEGRDLFVVPSTAPAGGSLVLADLQGSWSPAGWQLSDDLAFSSDGAPLIPSGPEGLGQPRLLPIAPLEQLLSGIGATAAQPGAAQLAIATAPLGAELLWLDGAGGAVQRVASLPGLAEALAQAAG